MTDAADTMIARTRVTAHSGEWVVNDDGSRTFRRQRTLTFDRGDVVPAAWLPFISGDRLAPAGTDLTAPAADDPDVELRQRKKVYDRLPDVDAVKAWIEAQAPLDQVEAARFAIAMESTGKERAEVYKFAERVLTAFGQDAGTVEHADYLVQGGS